MMSVEQYLIKLCADIVQHRYPIPYTINTQGIDIPRNHDLSDIDKAYIFLNYPRVVAHDKTPDWNIRKVLKVAGVGGRRRKDILNATCPDSIRDLFAQWNVEKRMPCATAQSPPRLVRFLRWVFRRHL